MRTKKIGITVDAEVLHRVDLLAAERQITTRSRAIQKAVKVGVKRLERGRLDRECAKLDPVFEQWLAEQDMVEDSAELSDGALADICAVFNVPDAPELGPL
ncbi:MAG TPA: CopG family transcriptional regulator [Thermoanaerobaculia bacterium]|nr:CopG family transcriptional regulator [Thermoanaerobaculia bacterium]